VFTDAPALRLLCLVTTPDRAEAILGDLTEVARSRGKVWFWTQWSHAFAAHAFKTVRSAPLEFVFLAIGGLSLYTFLGLTTLWLGVMSHPRATFTTSPSLFLLRLVFAAFVANLLTGLFLGRFASTRAMNGITPLLTVWIAYYLLWPLIGLFALSLPWSLVGAGILVVPFISILPLLVGGVTARRQPS